MTLAPRSPGPRVARWSRLTARRRTVTRCSAWCRRPGSRGRRGPSRHPGRTPRARRVRSPQVRSRAASRQSRRRGRPAALAALRSRRRLAAAARVGRSPSSPRPRQERSSCMQRRPHQRPRPLRHLDPLRPCPWEESSGAAKCRPPRCRPRRAPVAPGCGTFVSNSSRTASKDVEVAGVVVARHGAPKWWGASRHLTLLEALTEPRLASRLQRAFTRTSSSLFACLPGKARRGRVTCALHEPPGRTSPARSPVYHHDMAPDLHSLATVVPTHAYPQDQVLEVMKAWHGQDRRVNRLLSGIYRASDIDRRHSVVGDFIEGSQGGFFYLPSNESFLNPSTAERNALYAREAGELASCAAWPAPRSSSSASTWSRSATKRRRTGPGVIGRSPSCWAPGGRCSSPWCRWRSAAPSWCGGRG